MLRSCLPQGHNLGRKPPGSHSSRQSASSQSPVNSASTSISHTFGRILRSSASPFALKPLASSSLHKRCPSRFRTAAGLPGDSVSTSTPAGQVDSVDSQAEVPATADSDGEAHQNGSKAIAPAAAGLAEPEKGVSHRWKIVFMMAASFVLCNMDKVNMSVAVIPMAAELGWTATDRGLVSSAFFWGYSLTQIPAGWISTRIGGARVLMAGVALWSFGTLIAPPAAKMSLLALCASRVLVGLGEGFAPSAATNVMAQQVPSTERSRAVTTVFGGLDVGSAVGLLLCGPLIHVYGWPSVFYLFAVLGLVWCVFWPMFNPDMKDKVMVEEAAANPSSSNASPSNAPVPWGAFMTSKPVWAVIVAHFCFNWGYYTLLAWLPSYFEMALGLNVEKSSYLTLIPYVAMTMMTPFVGPIADGMVKSGVSLTRVRKICQGVAFVGPAFCMIACAFLTPTAANPATTLSVVLLVALLSLGFALGAWSRAGLYCNHQDLSPKYAGALLGITNTAGALPGVLGVTAAGFLLDRTASWDLALFFPTAACQIFGAIIYSIFASSERQSWS